MRGQWFDSLSRYWREFAKAGPLTERCYDQPRATAQMWQQPEHGTLARRIRVAPGERAQVRFAITWNYPLGAIYWFSRAQPGDPAEYAGDPPTWRNYYATQWADSRASGAEAFRRWGGQLEAATCAFRDFLFSSSHPPEIIDAVSGTLGVLRSATVIRLEGGELWCWEGQHIGEGSCEGSCTLSGTTNRRSLGSFRRSNGRCVRPSSSTISCRTVDHLPATFTARLRFRRDRTLRRRAFRRDDQGLSRMAQFRRRCMARWYWPNIKRSIEYAWSADNPNYWDPDKTGVLWGKQHHTLDMELFGPIPG